MREAVYGVSPIEIGQAIARAKLFVFSGMFFCEEEVGSVLICCFRISVFWAVEETSHRSENW